MRGLRLGLGLGSFTGQNAPRAIYGSSLIAWYSPNVGFSAGQYLDLSGNGRTLLQATPSKQPSLVSSDPAYNKQPSVNFVRANSQELVGSSFATIAQPLTVIWVGKTLAQSTSQGLVLVNPSAPVEIFSAAGPAVDIFASSGVISGTATTTSVSVMAAVFSGATSSLYQNASATNLISGNPGVSGATQIVLGSTNGANFLDGSLGDVIIATGTDATKRKLAFQYLGQKYGIAVS